jgi:hypothetical protein
MNLKMLILGIYSSYELASLLIWHSWCLTYSFGHFGLAPPISLITACFFMSVREGGIVWGMLLMLAVILSTLGVMTGIIIGLFANGRLKEESS